MLRVIQKASVRGKAKSSATLSNSFEQLLDHIAGLPLPQHPRLAQILLVAFAQLKFSDRDWAIFAITLRLIISRKTAAQDCQTSLDDGTMFTAAFVTKCLGYCLYTFGGMLDAINKVMRIFTLEALIECE